MASNVSHTTKSVKHLVDLVLDSSLVTKNDLVVLVMFPLCLLMTLCRAEMKHNKACF